MPPEETFRMIRSLCNLAFHGSIRPASHRAMMQATCLEGSFSTLVKQPTSNCGQVVAEDYTVQSLVPRRHSRGTPANTKHPAVNYYRMRVDSRVSTLSLFRLSGP